MVIETKDNVGTISNVHFDTKAERLINTKPTYWACRLIIIFLLLTVTLVVYL